MSESKKSLSHLNSILDNAVDAYKKAAKVAHVVASHSKTDTERMIMFDIIMRSFQEELDKARQDVDDLVNELLD